MPAAHRAAGFFILLISEKERSFYGKKVLFIIYHKISASRKDKGQDIGCVRSCKNT